MNGLSVWRVETLRLIRTRRLLVLGVLYLFLGASGPLVAKYAQQIFAHASNTSTVTITVAAPTPTDGILGYFKSAMQLGLIGCIVITGLAVCLDSRPLLSVFYRTRATVPRLLAPRLVLSMLASTAAYTLGFLFAWYETAVLLGSPEPDPSIQTWSLGLAYTAFATVLTFIASAFFRGALGAVGTAIAVVILLPIVGNVRAVDTYLPSRLTTLPNDIYHGASHPAPTAALLVTAAAALAGSALALRLISRRQAA